MVRSPYVLDDHENNHLIEYGPVFVRQFAAGYCLLMTVHRIGDRQVG